MVAQSSCPVMIMVVEGVVEEAVTITTFSVDLKSHHPSLSRLVLVVVVGLRRLREGLLPLLVRVVVLRLSSVFVLAAAVAAVPVVKLPSVAAAAAVRSGWGPWGLPPQASWVGLQPARALLGITPLVVQEQVGFQPQRGRTESTAVEVVEVARTLMRLVEQEAVRS